MHARPIDLNHFVRTAGGGAKVRLTTRISGGIYVCWVPASKLTFD